MPTPIKDILAIGVHSGNAMSAFQAWTTYGSWTYDIVYDSDIDTVDFENYRMIYIPSDSSMTIGGVQCSEVTTLAGRTADIATYVNTKGGSLMALTQQSCSGAYAWLPVTIVAASTNLDTVELTGNILAIVSTLQANSLNHCCYHGKFTGPAGYGGLNVLATDPLDSGRLGAATNDSWRQYCCAFVHYATTSCATHIPFACVTSGPCAFAMIKFAKMRRCANHSGRLEHHLDQ